MKILAINGSPNKSGFTIGIIDMLLEVCENEGAQCEKVNLEDYAIGSCARCGKCVKNGECFLDDDFLQLKAKMLEADGIVIGSPYYSGKPTEPVRVLMERLELASSYKGDFAGKYIVGVATSAVNNCRSIASFCANLGKAGFMSNGVVSGLLYENTITHAGVKEISEDEEIRERVKGVALKLLKDIKERRVPASYNIKKIMIPRFLRVAVVRFRKFFSRVYFRFRRFCEDKGWIKDKGKME